MGNLMLCIGACMSVALAAGFLVALLEMRHEAAAPTTGTRHPRGARSPRTVAMRKVRLPGR